MLFQELFSGFKIEGAKKMLVEFFIPLWNNAKLIHQQL